jgi:hypothetical protein
VRLPRFAATVIALGLLAAACSSPASDVATSSSAPAPQTSAPQQASLLPLPEASLGAQGTAKVQVELYLKSTADVAEQVDVTVAFRSNGKEFTRATVSHALQPGEATTVMVTPSFTGDVPMGYTSAIVAMTASDRIVIDDAQPTSRPEPTGQASEPSTPAEPSQEAVPPSGEASAQAGDSGGEPTGAEIESSGDYVCHSGVDNLPDLVRGSASQYDVLALQVVLSQLGYSPGPVDGLFGKRTETAVKSFQGDFGLVVDGQVGQHTWDALVSAYC